MMKLCKVEIEPFVTVLPQARPMEVMECETNSTTSMICEASSSGISVNTDACNGSVSPALHTTGKDNLVVHRYTSPDGIAYEILKNVYKNGRLKLYDSQGYSYLCKRKNCRDYKIWYCSVHSKNLKCSVYIKEYPSGIFEQERCSHSHPPNHDESVFDSINAVAKDNALKYLEKSVGEIVEEAVLECIPTDHDCHELPPIENIKTEVANYRKSCIKESKLFSKTRNKISKRKTKLSVKERKKKKKKYDYLANKASSSQERFKQKAWKTVKSDNIKEEDDLVLVYVPRRYFRKFMKQALPTSDQEHITEVALSKETDEESKNNVTENGEKGNLKQESSTQTISASSINNGHQGIPVQSHANDKCILNSLYQEDDSPIIREVWSNQQSPTNVSTFSEPTGNRYMDAEDMFFQSISAEVKELPKLAKSQLKLEILSLVNASLHKNAQG